MLDGFLVPGCGIVNLLLALRHAGDIFLQRYQLALLGAHEEQQILQLVDGLCAAVNGIVDADFQGFAVFIPEFLVVLPVLFQLLGEILQDVFLQGLADALELTALL